jgi:hypothetical protein
MAYFYHRGLRSAREAPAGLGPLTDLADYSADRTTDRWPAESTLDLEGKALEVWAVHARATPVEDSRKFSVFVEHGMLLFSRSVFLLQTL